LTAPGDIYPRNARQAELCETASRPDWVYLGGLLALDAGSIVLASRDSVKRASSIALRFTGPVAIGLTWGATVGGAWLALPKCSPHWIGESAREGGVRTSVPLALSLALLAGVTAPVVTGIAVGSPPLQWSTLESEMHLVAAGVAAFGGALLPYVLTPRTWAAARELDHLRLGVDARGQPFAAYTGTF
jgi:hypothetical protein